MSLWTYKYFVDVVDSRSFTKAGKKNFVSQTAVSQQISSLEKNIGGKLLERESKGLEITELGQIVYSKSKEILRIEQEMSKEIKKVKEKSMLRVGVDYSINNQFWVKIQQMLDCYYEDAQGAFEFSKISAQTGSRMLEEDSLDIYIGYGLFLSDAKMNMQEVSVSSNPMGVFVGNGMAAKKDKTFTIENLQDHTRYATKEYPCSTQRSSEASAKSIFRDIKCEHNLDTMKLKVEFNDGYAFVDSGYFAAGEGQIMPLADYSNTCIMKAFYKSSPRKKKIEETLKQLENVMK